jgi:hypothetical protein
MYGENKIKFVTVTIKTNQMHCCYNLILQNFFCMFRVMLFHNHGVSFRIQTLWYNGLSKYILYSGELPIFVTYRVEKVHGVELVFWLEERARYSK